ncbi:MAG TPA: urease accessory protein UreE [Castellaniella sp.]|jgi:urease accessory protein|nr:urease accessory protein UreE [Castellaniella sp.]
MRLATTVIPREQASQHTAQAGQSVTLTLAQRRHSRQRLVLSDGEAVGLSIARGTVLHEGDLLDTTDGRYIRVIAAHEDLLRVTAESRQALTRAAYHLGNRHVALEVADSYLQLGYDAVLADMLARLPGIETERVQAPFEPEAGAYGGGHHHGHDETFEEDYALAQAAFHAHDKPHPGHHS